MSASSSKTTIVLPIEYRRLSWMPDYLVGSDAKIYGKKSTITPYEIEGYDVVKVKVLGFKEKKGFPVHRLVAEAYVENADPVKNTVVNHENEDRRDNRPENLSWCSLSYNTRYSVTIHEYRGKQIPVSQYDKQGGQLLRIYPDVKTAALKTKIGYHKLYKSLKNAFQNEKDGCYIGIYWWSAKFPIKVSNVPEGFVQIVDFPGYWVSDQGQIYSESSKGFMKFGKSRDYLSSNITKMVDGQRIRGSKVHIYVALAFVENTDPAKTCVNHINGDKHDNRACNLEWCTPSENTLHAHKTGLIKTRGKSVNQYDERGVLVAVHSSAAEAARSVGIRGSAVEDVCNKKYKRTNTPSGVRYRWKWAVKTDTNYVQPSETHLEMSRYKRGEMTIVCSSSSTTIEVEYDPENPHTWRPIEGHPFYRVSKKCKVFCLRSGKMHHLKGKERITFRLFSDGKEWNPLARDVVLKTYPDLTDEEQATLERKLDHQAIGLRIRKPVIQCNMVWKEVSRFKSVTDAAKSLLSSTRIDTKPLIDGISAACRGKHRESSRDNGYAYGFKWKYVDDNNPAKTHSDEYDPNNWRTWNQTPNFPTNVISKERVCIFVATGKQNKPYPDGTVSLGGGINERHRTKALVEHAYYGGRPMDDPESWYMIPSHPGYCMTRKGQVYNCNKSIDVKFLNSARFGIRYKLGGVLVPAKTLLDETFPEEDLQPDLFTEEPHQKKRTIEEISTEHVQQPSTSSSQSEYNEGDMTTWSHPLGYTRYLLSKTGNVWSFHEQKFKTEKSTNAFVLVPTDDEKLRGMIQRTLNIGYLIRMTYFGGLREEFVGLFKAIEEAPGCFISQDKRIYNTTRDNVMTTGSGRVKLPTGEQNKRKEYSVDALALKYWGVTPEPKKKVVRKKVASKSQ